MSDIIGDAELTEMEDGDILMDSVSETKVKEIEGLIHLEYLKAGYKIEEICLWVINLQLQQEIKKQPNWTDYKGDCFTWHMEQTVSQHS